MKRIKPGRGLSQLSYSGSVFAILFGVLWTVVAGLIGIFGFGSAGFPFSIIGFIFPLFGIFFIAMAVKQARFHKHNATAKDRHSIVDITTDGEESDPFAKYDRAQELADRKDAVDVRFCTQCGTAVKPDDKFCPQCGNRIE